MEPPKDGILLDVRDPPPAPETARSFSRYRLEWMWTWCSRWVLWLFIAGFLLTLGIAVGFVIIGLWPLGYMAVAAFPASHIGFGLLVASPVILGSAFLAASPRGSSAFAMPILGALLAALGWNLALRVQTYWVMPPTENGTLFALAIGAVSGWRAQRSAAGVAPPTGRFSGIRLQWIVVAVVAIIALVDRREQTEAYYLNVTLDLVYDGRTVPLTTTYFCNPLGWSEVSALDTSRRTTSFLLPDGKVAIVIGGGPCQTAAIHRGDWFKTLQIAVIDDPIEPRHLTVNTTASIQPSDPAAPYLAAYHLSVGRAEDREAAKANEVGVLITDDPYDYNKKTLDPNLPVVTVAAVRASSAGKEVWSARTDLLFLNDQKLALMMPPIDNFNQRMGGLSQDKMDWSYFDLETKRFPPFSPNVARLLRGVAFGRPSPEYTCRDFWENVAPGPYHAIEATEQAGCWRRMYYFDPADQTLWILDRVYYLYQPVRDHGEFPWSPYG